MFTGYLSLERRPDGDWTDMTLVKTLYILLFKQEVAAFQLLPHFVPYCIPRG